MSVNFVYCFDKETANKLSTTSKLYKEDIVDGKQCWIYVVDNNNKINFNELDKEKVIITNRLNF